MKLWRVILSFLFGWFAFLLGILSYKWMGNPGLFMLASLFAIMCVLISMSLAQDDGIYRGRKVGGKG